MFVDDLHIEILKPIKPSIERFELANEEHKLINVFSIIWHKKRESIKWIIYFSITSPRYFRVGLEFELEDVEWGYK